MSPRFWGGSSADARQWLGGSTTAAWPASGWRFSLKGSPRHYDDVKRLIEANGTATVYFGEALAYERGAGVALWRVAADDFDWLLPLYSWWAEQERIEPIQFTFHLYLPSDPKYPVLNLREHLPEAVAEFIRAQAPREGIAVNTVASETAEGRT